MDKCKRERSANFTLSERDSLILLVQKYQNILENKQSDASTWKQKEAAWESIKNEFNARSGGIFRSTKTLKVKYEGLKRTVRKKSAAIRSELYRTGGGRNTASPLDSVEEHIRQMITLSTDGLESIYDSDILPQTQESQDGIIVPIMEEPFMDLDTELLENEATQNNAVRIEEEKSLIVFTNESDSLPATSTETVSEVKHIFHDNINDKPLHNTPSGKYVVTPNTSGNKKWDVTSRKNLKSRKHPSLIANLQKKTAFEELTQAKLELIQLQKGLLESEILEKRKEWEFNDKERKWKEEEYKLKLEKLRRELNE